MVEKKLEKQIFNLSSIPCKKVDILDHLIDQQAVLVIPEKGEVKVLNSVGAFIWTSINAENSVETIMQMVMEKFEVSMTVAEEDILNFLNDLLHKEMIFVQ